MHSFCASHLSDAESNVAPLVARTITLGIVVRRGMVEEGIVAMSVSDPTKDIPSTVVSADEQRVRRFRILSILRNR